MICMCLSSPDETFIKAYQSGVWLGRLNWERLELGCCIHYGDCQHVVSKPERITRHCRQSSACTSNSTQGTGSQVCLPHTLPCRYADYDYGGEEEGEQSAVLQQGLLPTINDPKLWIVQCRPGREREACMQLMQKFYTMAERNTPLGIKSAVCLDHLKGYFYVEAEKEAHVSSRHAFRVIWCCMQACLWIDVVLYAGMLLNWCSLIYWACCTHVSDVDHLVRLVQKHCKKAATSIAL